MELKDKVAVVTGASKGIGKAIAEELASNGVNLVLAARSIDDLKSDAEYLTLQYAIKALPLQVDLVKMQRGKPIIANEEAIKELLETTKKEFGHYDIIINAAGRAELNPFVTTDIDKIMFNYQLTRALNQDVTFSMMLFGRDEIVKNNGVIINITSDAGLEHKVYPDQVDYHTSKAAVNHMTRAVDLEFKDYDARAIAIAPGNVDTPLLRTLLEEKRPDIGKFIAGKVGSLEKFYQNILKPKDVAKKVANTIYQAHEFQTDKEDKKIYKIPSVNEQKSFEF